MDQKTQVRKALLHQLVKAIGKNNSLEADEAKEEKKEDKAEEGKGKKCPTCGHCS